MFNKSFFIKNQYLSNCDLINKYNLKDIYKKPKLNKIILDFSIQNFIEALTLKENKEKLNEIHIKSFLFLYLFMGSIPLINNKLKIIKNKDIKENTSYSLKLLLYTDTCLYNFLFFIFIENWFLISKERKNFLKKIKSSTSNKIVNIQTMLPVSVFIEMESIVKNSLFDLNSKEFNININFLINIQTKTKNADLLIKNLPLFWISG